MAKKKAKPKGPELKRAIVQPQDIVALTGYHEQTARRMLSEVRLYLGKSSTALVTVKDFAKVYEIEEDLIREYMI